MASLAGPGDVGIRVTLDEQQAVQGAQRTAQALDGLNAMTQRVGVSIDKMMQALSNTAEATQGIRRLMEAQKEEAEAAAKMAAEHKKHHEEFMRQKQFEAQATAFLNRQQQKEAQEAQHFLDEQARKQAQVAQEAADAEKRAAQERQLALQNTKQSLTQVGAAAAAMSYALKKAADEMLDSFKQQQSAFLGLEAVATRTIGTYGEAKTAAQTLANDGLMTVVEASKAVQAGLASGFGLEETINLIKAFKDSASFNRQAGLEFGESVVRAMEGIRMGNSILSDAAGVTKNLSQILKEAGFAEQDLMRVSSDAAVRRALYNGLLKEAVIFAGNAAKATETLGGAESRMAASTFNAKAALGDALAPAVQGLYGAMGPLLQATTDWAKANPELARTAFLVAGGIAAMTAALTLSAAALLAFNAALGPIGWTLVAVGVGTGALTGYLASVAATGQEAQRTKSQISDLVREYERLKVIVDDNTRSEDDHKRATNELANVLEQLKTMNPELVNGWNLNKQAIDDMTTSLDAAIEKASKWQSLWNFFKQLYNEPTSPEEAFQKARDEYSRLAAQYEQIKAADAASAAKMGDPEEAARVLAEANAQTEKIWRPKLKEALAKMIEAEKALGTTRPDNQSEFDLLRGVLHPVQTKGTSTTGSGDGKMSKELAAALEDLQDLQALEKSPEVLQRTLAKVREILQQHGAELAKLGKDRDLIRLRDFVLPQELQQAEFQTAMRDLNAQQQLGKLSPEQLKQGLEKIKADFADYLKGHPDEALQLDLRIKGASDDALRAPLERWQQAFKQLEAIGQSAQDRLDGLRTGLSLALAAGDMDTAFSLAGQIKQTEAALQAARFEEKFKAIGDAREKAFADAAKDLADLERQLIDEEAKGDKTDPAKVESIKQKMLAAVRPALEAEKAALEALLKDESLTAEQRAQVEQALNGVKQSLYDQDVSAHRIASDAKVAAERQAADAKAKAIQQEQQWIRQLAEADLTAIRARHKAEEERQAAKVKRLQEELNALEKKWAAEDRRDRIADLRTELANIKADARFQKVDPTTGALVWTYDEERARELEGQLADARRDDERARQRESLQAQITAAQEKLDAMRRAHANEEAERQQFWTFVESLDLTKYDDLAKAAQQGMGEWAKALTGALDQAKKDAETRAKEIRSILEGITNFSAPSLSGLTAPTLPASLAASTSAGNSTVNTVGTMNVILPNVTNAQQFAQQVSGAVQAAGTDVRGVLRPAQVVVNGLA